MNHCSAGRAAATEARALPVASKQKDSTSFLRCTCACLCDLGMVSAKRAKPSCVCGVFCAEGACKNQTTPTIQLSFIWNLPFCTNPILVSCEEGSVPGSSTVGCRSVRRVRVPANIITFSPGTLPDAAENAQLFCTAKEIMLLAFVFCRIDTCDTHTQMYKRIFNSY